MVNKKQVVKDIIDLYKQEFGREPGSIRLLPISGSDRRYFRLVYDNQSVIAAYNPVVEENIAFLEFTEHFRKQELPVPDIIAAEKDKNVYLISDLGDETLFSTLPRRKEQIPFSQRTVSIYKKVIKLLPEFQITAGKGLNYNACYPRSAFDEYSMKWDLNYFKYYFLKLAGISFDEQKLETSFKEFISILMKSKPDYFLYRDLQSRNIMIVNDEPYFIDYQGGRKGALQYDVASLLFDSKANIPYALREELLNDYIKNLHNYIEFDEGEFRSMYKAFVLIRLMQAMGAYGFRGFIEKKPVFLQSVPFARKNMQYLLEQDYIPAKLDYLKFIADKIVNCKNLDKYNYSENTTDKLNVAIFSFSYKNSIPEDMSGNGGGFVFDCRALPNPGREEKYKDISGLQKEVVDFLKPKKEVEEFLNNCTNLTSGAVENYIERGFSNLMISFGCTGGQHRSVYCAQELANRLSDKYDIEIKVKHNEELNWPG